MVDLEAFYTSMKNYSYFIPDSLTVTMNWLPVLNGGTAPTQPGNAIGYVRYHNFDLQSQQYGITCNVSVVINNNLNFRLFGTLQNTQLKNFYPYTFSSEFGNMIYGTNGVGTQIAADGASLSTNPALVSYLLSNNGNKTYTSSGGNPITSSQLVNEANTSTPAFYGGAAVDYTLFKKLNIYSMAYFYSNQTIETYEVDVSNALNASGMYKVEPKIIVDAKVSYKFWNENRIFLNARNLFNNDKREFAYTDRIGGTYLVGVSLNF